MMGRRPLVLGCALGLALSALSAHGGALEDFQTAIVRDNDRAIVNLLLRGMDPNTVDAHGQPALVNALPLESRRGAEASVPYKHLPAHEKLRQLVFRPLLEKKK